MLSKRDTNLQSYFPFVSVSYSQSSTLKHGECNPKETKTKRSIKKNKMDVFNVEQKKVRITRVLYAL